MSDKHPFIYCSSPYNRKRLITREVMIGSVGVGGNNPIRVQSMTTTDTMDTQASIDQSIRMIEKGCEIVRLTAPSKKEAENLLHIQNGIRDRGYNTPLVADIHFTPNAAEVAAKIVDKVRVNPGNYADKKRFEEIEYTDQSYQQELDRIEEKFTPLVKLCKENAVAMRIGTNHGSLSDRILSRYGDTPEGMVESAMEFLRICVKNNFHDIVLSMKASNTLVMVQAYRLLVKTMLENNMNYPLHLGVTEAGDGEDGRIKSAVGIGALLEDGIGDTIRVSLTEEPEAEIPVAQELIEKLSLEKQNEFAISADLELCYNPFEHEKRETKEVHNIGGKHVPVVFADLSHIDLIKPSHFFGFGYQYSVPLDKWNLSDSAADYVFIGDQTINFELPGTIGVVCNYSNWKKNYAKKPGYFPIIDKNDLPEMGESDVFFVNWKAEDSDVTMLSRFQNAVAVCVTNYSNRAQLYRFFRLNLAKSNLMTPVILHDTIASANEQTIQLHASSDMGGSLIDGFGDGLWLSADSSVTVINSTSFGILQATRSRISKTEYISCPSCGRTLFDLQETTGKIRERTAHLKGLKIGIMGCIVNGPGEMADADYGYVGTGPGKIHLYKEKTVVRKNVPEEDAVQALIDLIKENGDWIDPKL